MKTFKSFLTETSINQDIKQLKDKFPKLKIMIRQRDDIIVLDKIIVPDDLRNQGLGSTFMKELTDIADKNEFIIALTPTDDFGGSKPRLISFYKAFGFVSNKGSNKDFRTTETHIREPKR